MSEDSIGSIAPSDPSEADRERRDLVARVRSLRRWVFGLVVLTAFLVGSVVGGAAIGWHQWRRPTGALPLAQAVQALAGMADREQFRDAMASARREARPLVREVQAARADLARLLADPQPSASGLQTALARLRQAESAVRETLEPRVADVLAGFPPQVRRDIGQAILPPGRRAVTAPQNSSSP